MQHKANATCKICYALNGQYFYSSFGTGTQFLLMVFTTRVSAPSISLLFVCCYVESSDRFNYFSAHFLTTNCTGNWQGYGVEGSLRFPPTTRAFLFSKTSRLAKKPTQPVVQGVLWYCGTVVLYPVRSRWGTYRGCCTKRDGARTLVNPLKSELNPICYLLALLGAHHFLHVSRIRVKLLTFRLLMS